VGEGASEEALVVLVVVVGVELVVVVLATLSSRL
jgi:hypothetical protein